MRLRYTPLKVFHFPERLATLPRGNPVIGPPLHVRIKPTNVCCHHCRYCAYRVDALHLGEDMQARAAIPREKMREILDDLIAMDVKAVTFSGGGDPFCYPHLAEAAARLAASPVRFAALTNGARLEGEAAAVFARSASWLRISMDGWDGPSYARYRGVGEGEFSRVVGNIERFRALDGACFLGVSYIVDEMNAPHVFEFIGMAKGFGADSIKISPCIVSEDGEANNRYHAPLFASVREQIARARAAFEGTGFEIFDAYHQLQSVFDKPYEWCPYLQLLPVIAADQCVYSCQDKAYTASGRIGSIAEESFRAFWMREKEKFFRIVPSCDCRHHCVADGKNRLLLEYLAADEDHLGFV